VRSIDVVVVSFNSRDRLRDCVEHLAGEDEIEVVVVDNASQDGSLEAIADLRLRRIQLTRNGGFAHGCNVGWRAGASPFVLFLNPDAKIDLISLRRLAQVLEQDESVALVGPKIFEEDGSVALSLRRFPRLSSTYAHAFFLHRLFPRAPWASELVSDERAYATASSPDWVSGACVLVRRSALERLGGWDEGFFLYCEDKDLCRRIRDSGWDVRYEPAATAVHTGGASAPRPGLLPVLAASRVRYAEKHRGLVGAALERLGIALIGLTHSVVTSGGGASRKGHARALAVAAGVSHSGLGDGRPAT
jgi:N-acetylglucosaminyl-diphospho-decaprenol L-rhamnosyltransferase